MQLAPGETFAIVRQLADPNDSGTYYVRATVRNARTDALIATKDLTDRGSQRFSVEYQVPSISSDALYISISTRVYTNSGYTTLSDVYGQEIETYLVEMRQQHFGGGGSGVSYKEIRKILSEEMDARKPKPVEAKPIDLTPVLTGIQEGFRGMEKAFGSLEVVIKAINVNPVVDLKEVIDVVRTEGQERGKEAVSIEKAINESNEAIKGATKEAVEASAKQLLDAIRPLSGEVARALEATIESGIDNFTQVIIAFVKAGSAAIKENREDVPIESPYKQIREIMRS